jgi:hypothetical protein
MSSGGLDFLAGVLRPGGGLVVESAGLQASVQDADEPVGEVAQRSAVAGAAGPLGVVAGPGALLRCAIPRAASKRDLDAPGQIMTASSSKIVRSLWRSGTSVAIS